MDQLEEIKSKIDLVDLISSYLPLKKAGRNFKALCPFHSEKTPSFFVSPERQIWHCFGCGAGGDIFGFVMRIEGVEFAEALRILAQRAGVTLKQISPQLKDKKDRLYEINRLANLFYQKILLKTSYGKEALDYLLKKRQLPLSLIKKFGLGYAPQNGQALFVFLKKQGFLGPEIKEAGLVVERGNGYQDLFRHRIIFPFADSYGRIVGFTARALEERDKPKYLNTPQTLIFDKGKLLYRLDLAKEAVKEADTIILLEGQMDVLASYKVGVENVVCSSGTALTESQVDLIKRYTKNLILAFDMDLAGDSATKRGIEQALRAGLLIKVVKLPFGKDPDECIKKDPHLWQEAVRKPLYFIDFYCQKLFQGKKPETVEAKKRISQEIIPLLAQIPDKIEQSHWVLKVADFLKVSEKAVAEAVAKYKPGEEAIEQTPEISLESKANLLEERFLGLALAFPQLAPHFVTKVEDEDFNLPDLREIYHKLEAIYAKEGSFSLKKLKDSLSERLLEKAEILTLGIKEIYKDSEEGEILEEIWFYIKRLKQNRFDRAKKELEYKIKKAEREGNKQEVEKLMAKLQSLVRKEHSMKI